MARLPGPACDSCCAGCSVYDREKDAPGCWRVRFPVSSRPPEPLLLAQHYDVDDVLHPYENVLDALLELHRNLLLHQKPAPELHHPVFWSAVLSASALVKAGAGVTSAEG